MSHIKGGERLGGIAYGRQDARENLKEVEDFHFKGGRRFSVIREERGAGLFETIRQEAGGRRQEAGGRRQEAGGRQLISREEGG